MDYAIISNGPVKTVKVSGQLTFSDNQKFKQIIEAIDTDKTNSLTLDFTTVDFIDSAGLGMLLLLRDECQNRKITLAIRTAPGQVEKIFMISKFDQLFSMVK